MYGRSGRLDITISSRQERSKRVLIGKLVYSDMGFSHRDVWYKRKNRL